MNLGDMVNLIITDLGVFDDTSGVLARSFLGMNYAQLWDKYPWSDTQMATEVVQPLNVPEVPFPAGLDRIISIRARNVWMSPDAPEDPVGVTQDFQSDARFLDPINSTYLIETDPDMFERIGPVIYFEETTDFATGQRAIRLYPSPNRETRLYIVGKGVCPGFADDTSSSLIRNIDKVLVAYTIADMLQRVRQYGKADLKRKEAQELETNAWNLEQQQANLPRRTKTTTVAGNSLLEMTDAVCQICGQWTPDYRLIIREFIRRNYQTAYDTFLFSESLVMVRVPYVTEQVILPAYIDRVLGIRGTSNTRLFPVDAGLILDITPASFDEIGDPMAYTTLTPVAVSTMPAATTRLVLASTSVVDTGHVAIRGEVISTGQEIEEQVTLNGTTPVTTRYAYDIPLTIAKDITVGDVTVNALSDGTNLEVIPSYQRESKHQRLWFLPEPNTDSLVGSAGGDHFTCLVLGKRAIRPLLTEQDTPIITGIQQVLIAAAAADLFTKMEKPDLAAAMLKKADGSMAVLKAKNTDQAASAPRFVPQVEPRAYAGEYGGCGVW